MLDRGTPRRDRGKIAQEIETMGGALHVGAGQESISLSGQVLSRSLPRYLEVLSDLVLNSAFEEKELGQAREEMLGEIALAREEDRDLGDLFLRRAVYGEGPGGSFVEGTEASLPRITREDVLQCWKSVGVRARLIAGAAGNLDEGRLPGLLDQHFGGLPPGAPAAPAAPRPVDRESFEALAVDKPERTQTQLFLGQPALPSSDPRFLALTLAMHAFGGGFTSPLMQEVRVKRGWSYGAAARVEMNRGPGLLSVWTFPGNDDTIPAIRLLLQLLQELRAEGLHPEGLESARSHLLNMLSFEVETPEQLLQRRVQQLLLGLPADWTARFVQGIESVTVAQAREAIQAALHPERMALVMVATYSGFEEELKRLPGVRKVSSIPFNARDPSAWKTEWQG